MGLQEFWVLYAAICDACSKQGMGYGFFVVYTVGTLYMGGFDSTSIKKAFGIPNRYDVCCTIAVGYPDNTEKYHEHPRFPPSVNAVCELRVDMVYFENEFGQPMKTEVKEVKPATFWMSACHVCWKNEDPFQQKSVHLMCMQRAWIWYQTTGK